MKFAKNPLLKSAVYPHLSSVQWYRWWIRTSNDGRDDVFFMGIGSLRVRGVLLVLD